jgi:hypothetical protein
VLAAVAWGQYEVPRKANEYPAHASWARFAIGAEYLIHSIPTDNGSIFARDYLVVEVAIYPGKEPVNILDAHFTLCVNGKKSVLSTESPGFVAASLKYPEWEQRPTAVGSVGIGDGSVILGGPSATPRFPGDPTARAPVGLPRRDPDDRGRVRPQSRARGACFLRFRGSSSLFALLICFMTMGVGIRGRCGCFRRARVAQVSVASGGCIETTRTRPVRWMAEVVLSDVISSWHPDRAAKTT